MPMHRMVVIALGAVVSLSLQPGVMWAAADHTSVPAPDSPEGDPVIWQHPISTAIPLSSVLILRKLGDEPTGPTTPTAAQILNDDALVVVAEVQLRF